MKMLKRYLEKPLLTKLKPGKICLLLGTRRVGKTVFVKELAKKFKGKYLYLNGEDMNTQSVLKERSSANNELSNKLGISKNTVEKYLDLLNKVFILFRLGGFSRNLRKEISKSNKWYFYDNGIRNAIISDFRYLSLRNDIGELWENYFISERIKFNSYRNHFCNYYFWRTYDQQEIDFIEEHQGKLSAYEIKWGQAKVSIPKAFSQTYPYAVFSIINPDNYKSWITKR